MLASIFIYGGIQSLRDPKGSAQAAAPFLEKVGGQVRQSLPEQIPSDPATLVRIDAAVKVGAGTLLALGKWPRFSAFLLSGAVIPTTVAMHRFWEYSDPEESKAQQAEFWKNLGLLGGLLITAVDTGGKPSLAYRTRHGARKFAKQTQQAVAR
jgi:uncharacterized membrane protein YphA (DoxX/SURF4 family)